MWRYKMEKNVPSFRFLKSMEYIILFTIYGTLYCMMELAFRGHTHWSMFILGGLCAVIIGVLNEGLLSDRFSVILQMVFGGMIITTLEFICGYLVNIRLGWNVWDYSNMPCNVLGQICLPFVFLWIILSGLCIFVDDIMRHYLFEEPWPKYKIFK